MAVLVFLLFSYPPQSAPENITIMRRKERRIIIIRGIRKERADLAVDFVPELPCCLDRIKLEIAKHTALPIIATQNAIPRASFSCKNHMAPRPRHNNVKAAILKILSLDILFIVALTLRIKRLKWRLSCSMRAPVLGCNGG